jgi:phage-related tail fiber protein
MALESGTYVNSLNASNPASTDGLAQADDHIRLLKATIKATLPNVTGAITATQAELNLMDGVTATTAELNTLDGITSTVAELNILDGVTATAAELNITDGLTATTAELNITDGLTATTAELNHVDGVTSGIQAQLNALTAALANSGAPTGLVSYFANTSAPTGYIECNGSAVSRSTYSALFAVIGVTHGSGNGTSTFNVPDLRGEFIRGWDNSKGVDNGRAFGSSQADALQGHGHNLVTQIGRSKQWFRWRQWYLRYG